MITPEYQEWKEMLMDEITSFPAARLFKDGRIITIPQCTNKGRLPLFYALPIEIVSKQKEYVMPTTPLFYSITMKTEYEPKKVLLTVDVTALVTKEDSPGRSALLELSLPLQHL